MTVVNVDDSEHWWHEPEHHLQPVPLPGCEIHVVPVRSVSSVVRYRSRLLKEEILEITTDGKQIRISNTRRVCWYNFHFWTQNRAFVRKNN